MGFEPIFWVRVRFGFNPQRVRVRFGFGSGSVLSTNFRVRVRFGLGSVSVTNEQQTMEMGIPMCPYGNWVKITLSLVWVYEWEEIYCHSQFPYLVGLLNETQLLLCVGLYYFIILLQLK